MYALMALIFVLGYLCIALEHPLKIDKAAVLARRKLEHLIALEAAGQP